MHLRMVAEREEAGQGARDDDGIAHDHLGLGAADLGLRPGRRHDADRAVEGGQIERHLRFAVLIDAHDAGIERERLLCRQVALDAGAAVAADMDRARGALHAVDEQAVEIADVDGELALAEEIVFRIGRLEAGDVEDADVDRRDRDRGFFPRREAGELDRQGHGLARLRHLGRAERDVELALRLLDAEPGEADVERPMGERDSVGAGAPIGADLERRDIVAFDEVDVDELLYSVADDRNRRLAREMRGDAELGFIARGIARLVERDDDIVRRIGARRAGPADVEGDAGLVAVRRFDVEPVLAPSDIGGKFRGRVSGDVDGPLGDALGGLDGLIAPMAVRIVPLVIALDRIERPFDALARDARAVGGDRDRLEGGGFAVAEAVVEILLDADHRRFGAHRQCDDALDRSPARLGDIDDDLCFERLGGRALGHRRRNIGMAFGIGLQLVVELIADGGEFIICQAALIAEVARDFRAGYGLQ